MGIFSRLSDIINANLNSVLDRADEPERAVRLMIQEMEDTLVEVRAAAARVIADQKGLERKIRQAADEAAEWEAKAEFALMKDREDLATGALLERNRLNGVRKNHEEHLTRLKMNLASSAADVQRLEAKLAEARAKQALLLARAESAASDLRLKQNLFDHKIRRAFDQFEAIENRIDLVEGRAASYSLDRDRDLDARIVALKGGDVVADELAALKRKLGKTEAGAAAPGAEAVPAAQPIPEAAPVAQADKKEQE